VVEWVWADLAVLSCGGVSNGIYPTDAAQPGAVPVRGLRHRASCLSKTTSNSTRRWRCATQLPQLRKIIVFDMEGLRDLHDPMVMSLDALREPGPRLRRKPAPACCSAAAAVPARRPGDPGLHLRHDRQAQGRHASATAALCYAGARLQHRCCRRTTSDERMCFLAAVPHCRARGRRVLFALYRRHAQLRREPGNRSRERARDRTHRVRRRAAGVGKALLRRDDCAQRSPASCSRSAYGWGIGVGTRIAEPGAGRRAGRRLAETAIHAGPLAGAQQCAQA